MGSPDEYDLLIVIDAEVRRGRAVTHVHHLATQRRYRLPGVSHAVIVLAKHKASSIPLRVSLIEVSPGTTTMLRNRIGWKYDLFKPDGSRPMASNWAATYLAAS
jgi:hypothetical protein